MSFLSGLVNAVSPIGRMVQGGRALARGDVSGMLGAANPLAGMAQGAAGGLLGMRNRPTVAGTQRKMAYGQGPMGTPIPGGQPPQPGMAQGEAPGATLGGVTPMGGPDMAAQVDNARRQMMLNKMMQGGGGQAGA